MSEKDIENAIKAYVTHEPYSFCYKIAGGRYQRSGLPDLLGSYRGQPFAVEVKDKTGTPSPLQLYALSKFKGGGYVTGIVRSLVEFKALFDD